MGRNRIGGSIKNGIGKIVPRRLRHILSLIRLKWASFGKSGQLQTTAETIRIPKEGTARLRQAWKEQLRRDKLNDKLGFPPPVDTDKQLLEDIMRRTQEANRNNVTRAAAYYEIYRKHPELHWAFLAHMVTRNAGWSMTDLEGDLLPCLLNREARRHLFLFLERANALIFQDAYPQLLLYEESRRLSRPLFHLLPLLHISRFMHPVWEEFWTGKSSPLLTICLIINEQNYIEGRVVQNGYYQTHVLDTLAFQTQSLLQLNQVLLPYESPNGIDAERGRNIPRVAGIVLEHFSNLNERIRVGKKLYAMLFGIPEIQHGAEAFAAARPHTASRSDYWPHLFAPIKKASPAKSYEGRLSGCKLAAGADPLYSPPLVNAWKNHPIDPVERYEWFKNLSDAKPLSDAVPPSDVDMTGAACTGLSKIELAVQAAQTLGLG